MYGKDILHDVLKIWSERGPYTQLLGKKKDYFTFLFLLSFSHISKSPLDLCDPYYVTHGPTYFMVTLKSRKMGEGNERMYESGSPTIYIFSNYAI
jgi:hypothetical protein